MILIDNGHGAETPGKCSPDNSLKEWQWTRQAARLIVDRLKAQGIDARLLVEEDDDVSLAQRVRRCNALNPDVLVSVHVNAAGSDGKWHDARGFTAWAANNSSQASSQLAASLVKEMQSRGHGGNRWTPAEGHHRANFYILSRTQCPAVLTECLFMDNRDDVATLLSQEGLDSIVDAHVAALLKW